MEASDWGFAADSAGSTISLQDAQRSINYYLEVDEVKGAKMPVSLLGCPGLFTLLTSVPGEVRGTYVLPGGAQALAVIGNIAYLVTVASSMTAQSQAALQLTQVGSLLTSTGPVCIRDNGMQFGGEGGYAVIVDGPNGYYYTLTGQPYAVTFTGGLTNGSPTIDVPALPQGLVIGQNVTLTDTGGFIGVPTNLYGGSLAVGEQTTSQPQSPAFGGSLIAAASGVSFIGYDKGAFGSFTVINQGTLPIGLSLRIFFDNVQAPGGAVVNIEGFTADPGQDYLYSATSNGVTQLATDADYIFSGTSGQWTFPLRFGFTAGTAYGINIALSSQTTSLGFLASTFGTLTPGTVSGQTITQLAQVSGTASGMYLTIAGAQLPQSFFSSLIVNGTTLSSAEATYTFGFFGNGWVWPGASAGLVNGDTYPVQLTGTAAGAFNLIGFDVNSVTLTMSGNATGTDANDTITVRIPAFGQITDPGFLGADRIAFVEGWLAFNQPGTRTFFTTGPTPYQLLFPGTWFALKDSSTDNLVTLQENNREIWMIGERTSEVWYNAGNSPGVPFSRIPAVGPQIGCSAKNSLTRVNANLVWLGANEQGQNVVVMQANYGWQRISDHRVESAIASYNVVSDAIGYGYEEAGHWFYMLSFPTADATWCYDLTASQNLGEPCWHQRASMDANGIFHRHRSNCYMNFQNMRVVGDYENGQLYAMSRAYYSDAGSPLKALRRAPHVWKKSSRLRVFHSSLQVEFVPGVGLQSGQGQNPQAMLRWSDDGGFTWSNEHWASIGKAGETKNRAIWRRLGRSRDRVYEVSITDPVQRDIVGATLFFEPEA